MLTPPLPQPPELVDADATRRAFLKKVAVGGAVAAIGTQVRPLRAFAQEGEGSGDTGGEGSGDATEDGSSESPAEGGGSETTQPGSEGESEEEVVELTPDEARLTFLAGIGLAASTVYRRITREDPSTSAGAEEASEEESAASTTSTTTLPDLGAPPLAEPVVEVLRVFGSHHSQQVTSLNGLLTTPVEAPNGTLVAEVWGSLTSATDEAAILTGLRELEERIAATHLQALAEMEDANDAKLIATTLPVVSQHAVVLGQIGSSPTPLEELIPEEQTTDGFLDEATYPADGTVAPQDTPGQTESEEPESSGGGEGADPDTGTETNPDDGSTEQSGGGAEDGGATDSGGSANDPESEG